MKNALYCGALLMITVLAPVFAMAQQPSKAPLEVTADDALEWDRTGQKFIARGNAIAAQDGVSISAQTLTAEYDEAGNGSSDFNMHTMIAQAGVVLKSEDNIAYGEHAVYDLTHKIATLSGGDLRLVTPEQTIKARDRFEYHVEAGKLIALGGATIIRPTDTLYADKITATLGENAQGERVVETVVAQGNVVITTQQERVTGAYGLYDARMNTVDLTGGVVITRGQNILQGDRAKVDLNTQVSQLFGGSSGDASGRVTGTFYPDEAP